ncbi:peptidoglycan DD-metalloendopeptidase family protein [Mariniflexile sp.]|uniref:peptidoglycan DD-metalloendopeptidase family protein n=1 Tax=Mariniflexile sp. TaxID=1979402 RepID=UPI003569F98B
MNPENFTTFLLEISPMPIRVFQASIENPNYIPLNLSVTNTDLQLVDITSSSELDHYITKHINAHHGQIAFGGYNETRAIYKRSNHFNSELETERNIHIGIDLWCRANTPVFVPLDATVHSFKNNTNFGDYGPTIILKHEVKGEVFYTLYGHLSLDSIRDLKVGQSFKQGFQLATLGSAEINGDYPPHLHFQIIRDIENYKGDYPGVCNKKNLDFFLKNCPNPNLLLKLEV